MSELPRVPLLRRAQWISHEDVNVSIRPPIGRRIAMDVNEDVLAQFGARVVEHAIEQLGQQLPHLYAAEIQQAVDALLFNRDWLKPILEQEIRLAAREMILSLWSDDEKKDLRAWFDLLTKKATERE